MISFKVATFSDPTGKFANAASAIQQVLDDASIYISSVVAGNAEITLETAVKDYGASLVGAEASPTLYVYSNSNATYSGTPALKIQSGVDNNGSGHDGMLRISTRILGDLIAAGGNKSDVRYLDVLHIAKHELGHVLGFQGARDTTTGGALYSWNTTFDALTVVSGNTPTFNGNAAKLIAGKPVELAALGSGSAIYHTSDTALGHSDLMDWGAVLGQGEQEFSDLDLAIFKDLGYTIKKTLTSFDGRTFLPGTGAQSVSGTVGTDRVVFDGKASDYTILQDTDKITVTSKVTPANVVTTTLMERLQFSDTSFAYDADGVAGNVYRLYQAAFNRKPDASGLGYWIDAMEKKGLNLVAVAKSFIASPEFVNLFGANTTDTAFLTALYGNVLHRAPDAGGLAYWSNALKGGMSRADVLISFSDSTENRSQVILGQNGVEAQTYRLYKAAFDRKPDADGLNYWINARKQGVSLENVAQSFIASDEFKTLYGTNPTNTTFLTKLYGNVLDRAPDAAGEAWWNAAMDKGTTKAQVLVGFSESAENVANLVGVVQDIQYTPFVA